jgi:hypothetical protein
MDRRFTVRCINARGVEVFNVSTPRAGEALGHFTNNLADAGHDALAIRTFQLRLTEAALEGRDSLSVMDADLKGRTEFIIEH